MKIWFIEIGEPLPIEIDARLHRYGMLTKELAKLGHEIVWWTSNFSHAQKKFIVFNEREIKINGISLNIIKSKGYQTNISIKRILHQYDFAKKFYNYAMRVKIPDLIICPIPTIEVAYSVIKFGKHKNIPVIVDIRDEWPHEFIDLAPPSLRWIMRILLSSYFNKMSFICKSAAGIVGVSTKFLNYGISFTTREKGKNDHVIPIGHMINQIDSFKRNEAVRWWNSKGFRSGCFRCCFIGTIGNFFNFDTIIEAAKVLEKEFDLQIVICGVGSRLNEYKDKASMVKSVIFPGWIDFPKIVVLLENSNVGLAPYSSSARMTFPNKPFEYFSSGLPIISSLKGELEEILLINNCGYSYDANSVYGFCEIIRDLQSSKEKCRAMGENAKRVFEQNYSCEKIALIWDKYLCSILKDGTHTNKQ